MLGVGLGLGLGLESPARLGVRTEACLERRARLWSSAGTTAAATGLTAAAASLPVAARLRRRRRRRWRRSSSGWLLCGALMLLGIHSLGCRAASDGEAPTMPVKRDAVRLEPHHNVHRCDCFSACVSRVDDCLVEDPAQKDLQRPTRLRIDVAGLVAPHPLDAAAPRQPADGLLGYPLRRIPKPAPCAHRHVADRPVSRAHLARLRVVGRVR